MRFLALHQCADKDRQIADPDNGQPDIHIPFRLGIFPGFGHAHHITGCGKDDEQLVAPENETGEAWEGEPRAACALNDIEAGRNQCIPAKCEYHRRRMQRAQASECRIFEV